MGGSKLNVGYGNAPNAKWRGEPAGEKVSKLVNNLNKIETDYHTQEPSVCNKPTNYLKSTAFLDSAASLSLLGLKLLCKIAELQEQDKTLGITNGNSMETTQTVE